MYLFKLFSSQNLSSNLKLFLLNKQSYMNKSYKNTYPKGLQDLCSYRNTNSYHRPSTVHDSQILWDYCKASVKTVWEETTENRDHSIQGHDSEVYGFIEWSRIHREIKKCFISLICFYSWEDTYWTIKQTPKQWENPLTMALKHSRNGGTVFKFQTYSRIKMPL